MGNFRDFVLSPNMSHMHCEVEGCKNPITHYIVHETKDYGPQRYNFYATEYYCALHERRKKKEFRKIWKEDGVKTRIYEGKL